MITTLCIRLKKRDTQHSGRVVYAECRELALYAKYCYGKCHNAECHYVECFSADSMTLS
jgi:hypothetical protein